MHRKPLLEPLGRYKPYDEAELASLKRTKAFVRANVDCFERSLSIGHVTGAGWLLDAAGTKALLTHHRKLGKWLQLGRRWSTIITTFAFRFKRKVRRIIASDQSRWT